MERTELTRLKSLFGSNLLGPDELQPLVSRWNLAHCAPSNVSRWGLAHCAPSNGEAEDCAQGPVTSEKPLCLIYRQQRSQMHSSWLNCLSLNGTDIKKQLRDLHLALPIPLAIPYLKLLLKYYQRQC